MNQRTWDQIEEKYNGHPSYHSDPVPSNELDSAFAGFDLPFDYREFVSRYGGGFIGTYPIYGLRLAASMGTIGRKKTAVELTAFFRERRWPGTENWFIFTIDQGGMPIGFAADGSVWISDVEFNQIQKLGNDFEDFILKWCLRSRSVENDPL